MLQSLGYIGITTARVDAWAGFATDLLGMQLTDRRARGFALRTDDRAGRLFVESGACEGVSATGWEVADGDALARLAARLSDAGHPVIPGTSFEA